MKPPNRSLNVSVVPSLGRYHGTWQGCVMGQWQGRLAKSLRAQLIPIPNKWQTVGTVPWDMARGRLGHRRVLLLRDAPLLVVIVATGDYWYGGGVHVGELQGAPAVAPPGVAAAAGAATTGGAADAGGGGASSSGKGGAGGITSQYGLAAAPVLRTAAAVAAPVVAMGAVARNAAGAAAVMLMSTAHAHIQVGPCLTCVCLAPTPTNQTLLPLAPVCGGGSSMQHV